MEPKKDKIYIKFKFPSERTWSIIFGTISLLDLLLFWSKYTTYEKGICLDFFDCEVEKWEHILKYCFVLAYLYELLLRYLHPDSNDENHVKSITSFLKKGSLCFLYALFYLSLIPRYNSRYSFIYIFFSNLIIESRNNIDDFVSSTKRVFSRKIAFSAIKNPRVFFRRLRLGLAFIRWLSFVAPRLGALNKFRENVTDLIKKIKQHRQRRKAKMIRKKLLQVMTLEERRNDAAIKIQSVFRMKQARKRHAQLFGTKTQKKLSAASRIQNRIRRLLTKRRLKRERRKHEIFLLKKKQQTVLSIEDKKRILKLKNEFYRENFSLLLRPNTNFSVFWKILSVLSMLMEILCLLLGPLLTEDVSSIALDEMIYILLGKREIVEDLTVPSSNTSKIFLTIYSSIALNAYENSLSISNAPSSPEYEEGNEELVIVQYFVYAINIICFLDVFITFFTGDLHPRTGMLIPKPFIKRWIIPGLLLQLLVNPAMNDVAALVFKVANLVLFIDPARILRWKVCLVPFWQLFAEEYIFTDATTVFDSGIAAAAA